MQANTVSPANAAVEVVPVIRGTETVLVPSNQPLIAGDRVVTGDKAVDVRVRNAAGTQEAIVRVAPNSEIVVGDKDNAGAGAVADVEVVAGDAAFVDPATEEAVTMAKSSKSGAVLAGDSGMLLAGALLGGALLGGALNNDDNGGGTSPTGPGNPTDPTDPTSPSSTPVQAAVYDNVPSHVGFVADGGLTNDNTPSLLVGIYPEGVTPVLLVNGEPVEATYNRETGELTPNMPLEDGTYELSYRLEGEAGTSQPSPSSTVVIDTATPDPTINVSEAGAVVSGEAEPGSTVVIEAEGRDPVTVVADENGNYTATFDPPLAEDSGITVTATDEAGNTSNPVSGSVPPGGEGPVDPTDPTDPTDPEAADATLLSGAAVTTDNLTDTVDTLSESLGLNGVTDPLTQELVDPLVDDLTGLLDEVLIGTDGESGVLGGVGQLGDAVTELGEGTALEPVTGLVGDLVSNLSNTLNTLINQDALNSETDSTTGNLSDDLGSLTGDLTAGLDELLGTDTLVQDLLNPTADSLLDGTVGSLLDSGDDSTLLGGVDGTVDNATDAVQTLGDSLGLSGLTDPLTATLDETVSDLVASGEDLLIADGGLTDTLMDLGVGIVGSGDNPLTNTVGDLVTDLGGLTDTLAETDVLSGETTTATGDIGDALTTLTGDLTENLDDTLGTGDLVSDLLDPTLESLADTTLTPVLSGEEGGITQPLVSDSGNNDDGLLGGLLG
ncbi:Ig-like domain-containing protein [Aquabacterium sp. A08]|uniref:Ig-like domain-containing protein n=1 Tax=Aquabacterium sp. A08 TaxID=2718532 RepID=UPI001423CD98|nr:Ig-like domain-containing protein [Aquabacterium sp. A08]NIC43625.1 apolipoprotein A1/A4/E family protein [Aquabacterium sp. A08]